MDYMYTCIKKSDQQDGDEDGNMEEEEEDMLPQIN